MRLLRKKKETMTMTNKLTNLYIKHDELINYIIFGGLTTLVNIVVFFILETLLSWPYLIANAVAIVLSILFAYVTNKLFVFQTKNDNYQENIAEFLRFIGLRFISGLADMAAMWLLVDFLSFDTNIAKIATQFIVVVLNYFFSKFLIFV